MIEATLQNLCDRIKDLERTVSMLVLDINKNTSTSVVGDTGDDDILNDDGIPIGADLVAPNGTIMTVVNKKLYSIHGRNFYNLVDATIAASSGTHTHPWTYWSHGGVLIGTLFG